MCGFQRLVRPVVPLNHALRNRDTMPFPPILFGIGRLPFLLFMCISCCADHCAVIGGFLSHHPLRSYVTLDAAIPRNTDDHRLEFESLDDESDNPTSTEFTFTENFVRVGNKESSGMNLVGKSSIQDGAIQFGAPFVGDDMRSMASTQDVQNAHDGKAFWSQPVQLKKSSQGVVSQAASFSTSFTFRTRLITNHSNTCCGDGLLFLIASDQLPAGNLNSVHDSDCNINYQLPEGAAMVVEFGITRGHVDSSLTWPDSEDMDNYESVYVCLSLHHEESGRSLLVSKKKTGLDLRSGVQNLTAWIDYSTLSKSLQVRIGLNFSQKPREAAIDYNDLNLSQIVDEFMYLGFSASATGQGAASHTLSSWSFSSCFNKPSFTRTHVSVASTFAGSPMYQPWPPGLESGGPLSSQYSSVKGDSAYRSDHPSSELLHVLLGILIAVSVFSIILTGFICRYRSVIVDAAVAALPVD